MSDTSFFKEVDNFISVNETDFEKSIKNKTNKKKYIMPKIDEFLSKEEFNTYSDEDKKIIKKRIIKRIYNETIYFKKTQKRDLTERFNEYGLVKMNAVINLLDNYDIIKTIKFLEQSKNLNL